MLQSLPEESILAHLEANGPSTVDSIVDGTGIPRNQVLLICNAMCEQDDAVIRMFHDTEHIAKGRPKSVYELIPVNQPLCIKILGMLGSLKTTDQATEDEIAGALRTEKISARIELRTLEEFGYINKESGAWRISPGIIPPEPIEREKATPLKTRILQHLGGLKASESQNIEKIIQAVSAPEVNVRAALKNLRSEKLVEGAGRGEQAAWKLAPGVIPPEETPEPSPVARRLTDIKKYIPARETNTGNS